MKYNGLLYFVFYFQNWSGGTSYDPRLVLERECSDGTQPSKKARVDSSSEYYDADFENITGRDVCQYAVKLARVKFSPAQLQSRMISPVRSSRDVLDKGITTKIQHYVEKNFPGQWRSGKRAINQCGLDLKKKERKSQEKLCTDIGEGSAETIIRTGSNEDDTDHISTNPVAAGINDPSLLWPIHWELCLLAAFRHLWILSIYMSGEKCRIDKFDCCF